MARFGSLDTQYFDDAGNPLVSGKIYFYETGTTTPKNTYADINYTIANSNPVILTAAGRQPNIFFDGVAKAILTKSDDTQILVRDPVGDTASTFGNAWIASKDYNANDVVQGSDGEFYVSLVNGNVNNNPVTTSGYWTFLYSVEWDSGTTYKLGSVVTYQTIVYQSLQNANLNKNPSTETSWWVPIQLVWSSTATYAINANVVGTDGILYTSLQNANTNHIPASSPSWWVGTSAAAASSASAAATSASNAASSASAASTSASNAATSESNAAASASTASTQATNASNYAAAASTSATNAANSASSASTSASNAAASYDLFDDRYLGAKASDPSVDNDGNPLVTGAMYFNTTSNTTRIYNGSGWQDSAAIATSINLATQVSGTLAVANGGTGITSFGAGIATFLGTPSSANLASAVTDETGSGALVFGTSPTLTDPKISLGGTNGTAGQVPVSQGAGLPPVWGQASGTPPTQQIFTFTPLTGTYSRAASVTGTYSQTTTVVTVTRTAHGFSVGDWVYLDFTSGTAADSWYQIFTVPTADTFTVTRNSASTSGNVTIHAPIVVTVNGHGRTNGTDVFIDWTSGGMTTDAAFTVRQATTNTFQAISSQYSTTPTATSGNCTLPQIGNQSQTWTRPTGCKAVEVELVAAGEGTSVAGGGAANGRGGGYSRKFIDVTSIASVAVTVGAPGCSSSIGLASGYTLGGASSFGSHCSATCAGNGSNGDINLFPTPIFSGVNVDSVSSAISGASPFGVPAIQGISGLCTPVILRNASGYGAGGAQGGSNVSNATAGVVIVREFY